MSTILIQKTSITDLSTDAIVNAANSGLRAGGGVCGAIFQEAGYCLLQDACDSIGHCDTGSAVITPGFYMKSKYIIHAVGPIWQGGNQGEKELLRKAYWNSLKLANQNMCHSIAFPLISSGIYGYPVKQAWEVALKACNDFIHEYPEIDLDIVFAVLNDTMVQMGNDVLKEIQVGI